MTMRLMLMATRCIQAALSKLVKTFPKPQISSCRPYLVLHPTSPLAPAERVGLLHLLTQKLQSTTTVAAIMPYPCHPYTNRQARMSRQLA